MRNAGAGVVRAEDCLGPVSTWKVGMHQCVKVDETVLVSVTTSFDLWI